ncbi:MAG: DUF4412 domain-containing protein [Candidatus Firestonebacteria bacterium]|nr:DUF4412 domain-containing protein [Candidatus Firestonebacteria bacterium]
MLKAKNINILFNYFCISLVFPISLYAGVIIEQIEGSTNYSGTLNTVLYFSGDNMRTDELESNITTISRFREDTGYSVSHKKKTFIKYKLSEKARELTKIISQNSEKVIEDTSLPVKKQLKIIKTGDTKVINGFNVSRLNVIDDNKIIEEVWVTNDIDMSEVKNIIKKIKKQHELPPGFNNNEEYEVSKAIEDNGFLILSKRYSEILGENLEDFIEVKKIEKKKLEDDIFLPPEEYRELKMNVK